MAQGAQGMALGALDALKHTAGVAKEDDNKKNTNSANPKQGN